MSSWRLISKANLGRRMLRQLQIRARSRAFITPIRIQTIPRQNYSKSSLLFFGGVLTSGLYVNYQNKYLCAPGTSSETQLLSLLGKVGKEVDTKRLLKRFQHMLDEIDSQTINISQLKILLHNSGIDNDELVQSIFDVMDWNGNGLLEPHEVSAVLTLLQKGSDKERYEFLFYCIDLDHSGKVDKQEMRQMVRALLQARYHIHGLEDRWDQGESFTDIEPEEYRALAKYKSNKIVRDIFDYADTNRDGELNKKEFLRWCRRGGREVDLLTDILTKTLQHDFK